jgi:transcriptional regulator with XRE-family HTH domain
VVVSVGANPGRARPAEWLRQRRVAAGLTQEDLAERSGVSVRAIADLERGRTRRPYPSSVRALVRALGLPDSAGAEIVARYRAGRAGGAGTGGGGAAGPPGAAEGAGAGRAGGDSEATARPTTVPPQQEQPGDLSSARAFCRKARYDLAMALAVLGDAYASTGDVPGAREAWRESADILEGLRHPGAGEVRGKLAMLPTA